MARAFQCDLCGLLEEGQPSQAFSIKPLEAPTATQYEACTDCARSHLEWQDSRRPRVYDQETAR